MKLHVLGLAHTETTRRYSACAYTQRTMDFASMMTRKGYDVRLYSGTHNDAFVTEHVPLMTPLEQARWFPDFTPDQMFNNFDSGSLPWTDFNMRCVDAVRSRAEKGDVLCITMGLTQKPVADRLAGLGMFVVETGIGYEGVFSPYRVFESQAWRHYMASKEPNDNLRWFDDVIPRGYFVQDFPLGDGGKEFLFLGRLISRKGLQIAAETCKRLGATLLVAGQGMKEYTPGERLVTTDGTVLECDVRYLGVLSAQERAAVMGSVKAVFMPTYYLEPGGGVAIEAQLCGTPVITTPWGAMTETVLEGRTGFHCSVLSEFMQAAVAAGHLDRCVFRQRAVARYSAPVIAAKYDKYFTRLATLSGDGWYAT